MKNRKTIGIFILVGLALLVIAIMLPGIYYPGAKEMQARSKILNLMSNQRSSFRKNGVFDTPVEAKIDEMQSDGYKIEMTSDGKSFQIWATPIKYWWTGKVSFYADSNDGDIRGADHKGEKAEPNDPIVYKLPEELKEILRKNRERK